MKKSLLGALLLALASVIHAQSLERSVIAGGGTVDKHPDFTLEWTLGEVAVQTYDTPRGRLSEGFHQPKISILPVFPVPEEPVLRSIAVFPNPTATSIRIRAQLDERQSTATLVFDADGRLLPLSFSALGAIDREVNLEAYPAGVYRLLIQEPEGRILHVSQIIKQ